ncbi:aminodeoxychorismate/anthranilate synthase component II [Methanogenium sp. S4BF]|uniref:anthranilate synthase component II n=1 Tax=Methanogenium sp. S4BF TaxID=1789226 RepID=UPI002416A210|nr:aminodeoxychorismate/anthranilate synthase component II [Methanogenium sp. S4BF]WFN33704.1 aminodeoxychorismate/anthranilate synthase component II [Methanogenium sp. S4BF]
MKVLVIDCYDSFTYNLCQMIGRLGAEPVVVQNDVSADTLRLRDVERVILSPGPGRPEESGLCLHALTTFSRDIPTLGVCLGHQAICQSFGGEIVRAQNLMHGMTSLISHDRAGIFSGIENPFTATRYHSLIVDKATLPDELAVTAVSCDDGYVMGVRHRDYPIEGIQFHPESILTEHGLHMMENFLGSGCR